MAAHRYPVNPITGLRSSARASARQQWLLLGAVLLAVGLFGLWNRATEYRELQSEQQDLLEVQAAAVETNLSQLLLGLGAGLRGVRADLPQWSAAVAAPAASRRLKALSDAIPGVQSMLLLAADGRVLAASRPGSIGLELGSREDFKQVRSQSQSKTQAQARPASARLWLSAPFVNEAGSFSMNITVAVMVANGAADGAAGGAADGAANGAANGTAERAFGGAISATLEPAYLQKLLHATLYAPDVWAGLAHGDGGVPIIEPRIERVIGTNVDKPGSMFRRHRESGRASTVLTGRVTSTGDVRVIAQRTVQPAALNLDKPIIVAVSRSQDAMLAPWWRQTLATVLLYTLLCAASSAALVAMQRRQSTVLRLEQQREATARQSAERLELALRGADLALWDADLRSLSSTVNERWSSMLGLPHQPVLTDPQAWSSRVHPDDWERVNAAQQAHVDGRTERFEAVYRMRHADGHWIWILDRAQVLERDASGKALRMAGTHMDTTGWMEGQQALERSEQSLATTLQSIGDAVIATDPLGLVVRMNATAERLTGWSAREATGQPLARVFRIVTAPTRQPASDPVRAVLAHGQVIGLANDTVLLSRDGSEYQIADSAAPIRAADGEVTGVVLVFSDVTERYRVQQALRANEERLRSLLDNLQAGVLVFGADGQLQDANPAARRIAGLSLEQMQGQLPLSPNWALLEEDQTPLTRERQPVNQVLASGQALKSLVMGVRRPDLPRPLWVLANAYPVLDAAGGIEQVVVTFSDITERKEAEAQRLAQERQRRDSHKLEAIGTLAGGIAHDFNNILAAILGNLALARQDLANWQQGQMKEGLLDPQVVSASLEQINRAALRARDLVQQILSFSRQDAGGFKPLLLAPVVEETLSLLRSTLPAGVRLDAVLPTEQLRVHGDSTQLQQVLLNLCTNAWHALPAQGGVSGRIEVGLEAATDERVHLWVRDNGSGMDDATRQRIFDPFFTTKTVGQGTGLGLSVVHGIVGAHGGTIVLDTAPGQGSTFHLYLPRLTSDWSDLAPVQPPAPPAHGGGQHVLYIDDDEVMVLMVERLLQRAGFRVSGFSDAKLALARVRAHPDDFDAVVTDFNMPGLSGLQVAQELARIRPALPVVISSGFLTDALREQAAAAGVRAVMQKERTIEDLADVVVRVLAAGAH